MTESAVQTQRGFTLLEIMISLVLICIAVISLMQLSSANLRNLAKSDDHVEALAHANDKMRDVLDQDAFEERSWEENDNEGYVYDITIHEIEEERSEALAVRLMQITVTARHAINPGAKTITLKTAKMVSRSDDLIKSGKDSIQRGSVH